MAFALKSVMTAGTGMPGNPRDGVPIVGKTGTAEESHQNWLVATTTKVSLAVWVGNIVGGQSLRKISVAGTNGYNTKFNIFRATMASLDGNPEYRGGEFPEPDQSLLRHARPVRPAGTEAEDSAGHSRAGAARTCTAGAPGASGTAREWEREREREWKRGRERRKRRALTLMPGTPCCRCSGDCRRGNTRRRGGRMVHY